MMTRLLCGVRFQCTCLLIGWGFRCPEWAHLGFGYQAPDTRHCFAWKPLTHFLENYFVPLEERLCISIWGSGVRVGRPRVRTLDTGHCRASKVETSLTFPRELLCVPLEEDSTYLSMYLHTYLFNCLFYVFVCLFILFFSVQYETVHYWKKTMSYVFLSVCGVLQT